MAQKMHQIIDTIVKALFQAEDRRLQSWTDRLCEKNRQFHWNCQMFFWNGHFFRQSNVVGRIPKEKRARLHSSLTEEADAFLKDKQIVDNDRLFIKQAIFSLLEKCQTTQDIRDALPEFLVDLVQWEVTYPRTREAAFTIQNDPRALKNYQDMLDKMQIYSTTRLIY